MKATTKLIKAIGAMLVLVFGLAISASANVSTDSGDNPPQDIHSQIHNLLEDFDFSLLPHHGTETVNGIISIDRTGRIFVKDGMNSSKEIDAQVFRHLDQKLLYNIEEYRGKKVIVKITLQRRN